MEMILEKKNDRALHIKHRKMKTTICNFERKLGKRKKEKKRGKIYKLVAVKRKERKMALVDRYTVPMLK